MKLAEILYREILFHSDNGKAWIEHPFFLVSEVHKITGVPRTEVIILFKKWIDIGFVEKITNEAYAIRISVMFDLDQLPV